MADLQTLAENLSSLTVLEASELVKILELYSVEAPVEGKVSIPLKVGASPRPRRLRWRLREADRRLRHPSRRRPSST